MATATFWVCPRKVLLFTSPRTERHNFRPAFGQVTPRRRVSAKRPGSNMAAARFRTTLERSSRRRTGCWRCWIRWPTGASLSRISPVSSTSGRPDECGSQPPGAAPLKEYQRHAGGPRRTTALPAAFDGCGTQRMATAGNTALSNGRSVGNGPRGACGLLPGLGAQGLGPHLKGTQGYVFGWRDRRGRGRNGPGDP